MTELPFNHLAWAEIPVSDMAKAQAFYEAVLHLKMAPYEGGANAMASFGAMDQAGVSAHIYPGKPAGDGSGPSVHLTVSDRLEDAMERVKQAGGTVLSEPIPIPYGRFVYILDLDGNSIGLFEMKKG